MGIPIKQLEEEFQHFFRKFINTLIESEDSAAVLHKTLEEICRFGGWTLGEVWLRDAVNNVLNLEYVWHNGGVNVEEFVKASKSFHFPPGVGIPGRAWKSKKTEWVRDVSQEPEASFLRVELAKKYFIKAAFGVPLIIDDEVAAVFVFFMREITEKDEELINEISKTIGELSAFFKHKLSEGKMQFLQNAVEYSEEPVLILSVDAAIIYANKAWQKLNGYQLEEVLGKNLSFCWNEAMANKFSEKIWPTVKNEKKTFVSEVFCLKKDNTAYWKEIHLSPILDEGGDIKYFVSMELDITERKKQDEFKEQFISAVGHQTRNPLTATQGVLKELLFNASLGETERKELEKIYKENQTLTDLIKDLLILSRIENRALELETIKLDEELANAVESVRKKHQNISFLFQNEVGPVPFATIKSLALQVFLNIIYNAAEYANKERGEVIIKLQKFSQGILFSCYNNGVPIPEDIQPLIFSKISSISGGEGLGLYIVKMICDYLTWKVTFRTGKDGTTFYVIIPWPNQ